jgi:excisionase family DNA binding protein
VVSMLYSITEAAKQTGLGEFTILRAIEDGRIAGTKDLFGEWHVAEEDLHRFELAIEEDSPSQAPEDGVPNSPVAAVVTADNSQQQLDPICDPVAETNDAQSPQALSSDLIGASALSPASAEHDCRKVSVELQESRRIFVRFASSRASLHCGSTWDDEIRLDDRDKKSEAVPHAWRWPMRSFPRNAIVLLALGWIGGLSSYHFLAQRMGFHHKVVSGQTAGHEKQPPSFGERRSEGTGSRFAATGKSNGFDHPRRQLRSQAQPTQRSASKLSPEEEPATTQSTVPKQQDRVPTPALPFPETRPASVSGWTLRGVVDGTAVLDGPYGTWKVVRGDLVPGLGRVDSIVLWGSRWIVATSRGLVTTP